MFCETEGELCRLDVEETVESCADDPCEYDCLRNGRGKLGDGGEEILEELLDELLD